MKCPTCKHWKRFPYSSNDVTVENVERIERRWLFWKRTVTDGEFVIGPDKPNEMGDCSRYPKVAETWEKYGCGEWSPCREDFPL